jgi:hypothetical protein
MKKRNFDPNALTANIFDYMFSEWLCRRGLYSKFVANLPSVKDSSMDPRAAVHGLIIHILDTPYLTMSDAVLSAFGFESTPEGSVFWLNVSREWENFAESLPHLI